MLMRECALDANRSAHWSALPPWGGGGGSRLVSLLKVLIALAALNPKP